MFCPNCGSQKTDCFENPKPGEEDYDEDMPLGDINVYIDYEDCGPEYIDTVKQYECKDCFCSFFVTTDERVER
jgi:hypothetical protein